MPNWCENDLRVSGPEEQLNAFLQKCEGESPFDFERILPTPDGFLEDERWYHWRITNWGTKWPPQNVHVNEMFDGWEDCEVLISYDTAWAPPKPVIIEASRQHPALTFTLRYYECGCAFHGLFVVKNGEVESDLCADYYGERGG